MLRKRIPQSKAKAFTVFRRKHGGVPESSRTFCLTDCLCVFENLASFPQRRLKFAFCGFFFFSFLFFSFRFFSLFPRGGGVWGTDAVIGERIRDVRYYTCRSFIRPLIIVLRIEDAVRFWLSRTKPHDPTLPHPKTKKKPQKTGSPNAMKFPRYPQGTLICK
jgi:hypothetical protein